jgi:hypothetical protein
LNPSLREDLSTELSSSAFSRFAETAYLIRHGWEYYYKYKLSHVIKKRMTTASVTTKDLDREAMTGGLGESINLIVHRFHSIYSRFARFDPVNLE